jgi:hypothetical protein
MLYKGKRVKMEMSIGVKNFSYHGYLLNVLGISGISAEYRVPSGISHPVTAAAPWILAPDLMHSIPGSLDTQKSTVLQIFHIHDS